MQTEHCSTGAQLSLREKQIVTLVTQAKLNKEIAYELKLAEGTIKVYLVRLFRKVGVTNRTQLALWAMNLLGDRAAAGNSSRPQAESAAEQRAAGMSPLQYSRQT